MPTQNQCTLNLADWIGQHRKATEELQTGSPGIDRMHQAIDCALPDRALELVDAADLRQTDPAELDWVRCRALWENSRWDEVRALAATIPAEQFCEPLRLRVLIRAAWTDLLRADLQGEFIGAVERFRPWVVQGGSLSHTADLAHLDAYRHLVFEDNLELAARRASLAASLYAHLEERGPEIKSRILCIRILAIEGQLASATDEARLCVEAARRAGHPRLLVQALNVDATLAFRRGDWAGSLATYDAALRLAEEFEDARWCVAVLANRARVLAFSGDLEQAEAVLTELKAERSNEATTVAAVLDEYRGQVALLRGDAQRALGYFDATLQRLVRDGVQSYERSQALLRKAEALVALEEYEAAHACTEEALDRLAGSPRTLERGHLLHLRGIANLKGGRPREAAADFETAIVELRRVGDQWTLLRCLLDRVDSGLANPRQCVSDCTEARALATRLGHADLEERAQRSLTRSELDLHRIPEPMIGSDFTSGMIAKCAAMRTLVDEARMVAPSNHPVLLEGETGTGKEVFARFLHECSARKSGPFVPVNCAAIPEALFEREFFGHARGSFTGAVREARGLMEEADGGTLFLDELSELPPAHQPKLLRLLQEGSYRRVGETRERQSNFRIISATNRPLCDAVAAGSFRDDLFYRLNGFELQLPPLRERAEDIMALAWTFLRQCTQRGEEAVVEPAAWRALRQYTWPGNVRELQSAMGSAWVRARATGVIRLEHLPVAIQNRSGRRRVLRMDLMRAVRRTEREMILEALERAQFRRADAAQLLGIGRNTLYEKMKKLGIRPQEAEREVG
jgi:DNA-binding NtrC family response regulator